MILNTTSFGQDNTTISLSFKKEVDNYPDIPIEYKEYMRLSIGLEDYMDIIDDLEKAFKILKLYTWKR